MFKPRLPTYSPNYSEYKDFVIPHNFVQRVEKSQHLTIGEKIELLALSMNRKMTTEIYMKIPYVFDGDIEKADPNFLQKLEKEVISLGLPYHIDTYIKLHRSTGKQREFVWFQVSRNQLINQYIQRNNNILSDPDYGVLYGFPTTAIQAMSGFIQSASQQPPATIGRYYFGGVYSQEFLEDECDYFDKIWSEVSKLSSLITAEAQQHYQEYLRTL